MFATLFCSPPAGAIEFPGMRRCFLVTTLIVLSVGVFRPAQADTLMTGTWTITRAEAAPWSGEKSDPPNWKAMPDYVGKRVTFAAARIDGPRLVACDKPKY